MFLKGVKTSGSMDLSYCLIFTLRETVPDSMTNHVYRPNLHRLFFLMTQLITMKMKILKHSFLLIR